MGRTFGRIGGHCIETCEYFIGVTQEESSGLELRRAKRAEIYELRGRDAVLNGCRLLALFVAQARRRVG